MHHHYPRVVALCLDVYTNSPISYWHNTIVIKITITIINEDRVVAANKTEGRNCVVNLCRNEEGAVLRVRSV